MPVPPRGLKPEPCVAQLRSSALTSCSSRSGVFATHVRPGLLSANFAYTGSKER